MKTPNTTTHYGSLPRLTAPHVRQAEPRPLSARVLMTAARRLRLPGAQFTDLPAAVMTCGRLASAARLAKPTGSDRVRSFWGRMVSRFALAEIVTTHDYYAAREDRDGIDADGRCVRCQEIPPACECP